jgi:sulfur-carrier protein
MPWSSAPSESSSTGSVAANIARTLCDLGAVVPHDKVEQALDDALRRGVSKRRIREGLDRAHRPGRTGTGVLRDVLDRPDRRGPVADSMFERFVERLLAASSLPAPVRQLRVREPGGNRRARLDLAWPDVMLAVEPAGARFHGGPRRQRAAAERRKWLEALGWLVIDVFWSDLGRPEWLVDKIEARPFGRGDARLRHWSGGGDLKREGGRYAARPMSVTVRVPTTLRPATGGVSEVKVDGATLAEVLDNLEVAHPGFRSRIFDDDGNLRRFVNLFVADDDVRFLQGLDTPVPDGETVSIIPAVAGG